MKKFNIFLILLFTNLYFCTQSLAITVNEGESIQAAIDGANPGEEILVGPGVFPENLVMEGANCKSLSFRSVEGPELTILGSNEITAGSVLAIDNCTGIEVTIDGFTFTGGKGTTVQGGIFLGGGIYTRGADVLINDCIFENNEAHGGGGINMQNGDVTILHALFINNTALDGGFLGGGALRSSLGGTKRVWNSSFINNTAQDGGAISVWSSGSLQVVNSQFYQNHASHDGGAIWIQDAGVDLINSTLTGNTAEHSGGAAAVDDFNINISNSILWGNHAEFSDNEIYILDGSNFVIHSIIEEGFDKGINISEDPPLFACAYGDNPDLRLLSGSPAIDQGLNGFLPQDEFDFDGDGDFGEEISLDLAGNDRIINRIVDMGAFEWGANVEPCCPADLSGDGMVDVQDLVEVILNFGFCEGCAADLDGNGEVDVPDLIQIILNWGEC